MYETPHVSGLRTHSAEHPMSGDSRKLSETPDIFAENTPKIF
jgi:hypothetical protein